MRPASQQKLHAPLVVIADGCFSNFRKSLLSANVSVSSHFVGLVLKNVHLMRANFAEVVLTRTGPILIYQLDPNGQRRCTLLLSGRVRRRADCPVDGGVRGRAAETRMLVDVPAPPPSIGNGDMARYLLSAVAPELPVYLQQPFCDAVADGPIRQMPNSFLPPCAPLRSGLIVLGDAFNMRHPLTGGGMTVAFCDLLIWRSLLARIPDLRDDRAIVKAVRTYHWRRKRSHAFVVNVLAQALYPIFAANDGTRASSSHRPSLTHHRSPSPRCRCVGVHRASATQRRRFICVADA